MGFHGRVPGRVLTAPGAPPIIKRCKDGNPHLQERHMEVLEVPHELIMPL